MAMVKVINWSKEVVGEIDLPESVFGVEVKPQLIQEVVRWQVASRRQGTHATKTRAFVRGGGKKPFKQKGTGNARQGSSRSPLMPGGATLFGPAPKDYSYSLPKKVRVAGLKSALSGLFLNGKVTVVDGLNSAEGKTKNFLSDFKRIGVEKALVVDFSDRVEVKRVARNLPNLKYVSVAGVNVFDLLKYGVVVLSKEAVAPLIARLELEK